MWQQDDDNTVYNWFEATGQSDPTYNPGGGIDVCGNLVLAGHSDWRTPSITELISIVKWDQDDPSIALSYFPSTKSSDYWSATPFAGDTVQAHRVDFIHGRSRVELRSLEKYVRCVRGSPLTYGIFNDNGDGTVSDFSTALIWQQATGPGVMTWYDGNSYCEGLSLAGYSDWRMPQVWELTTIVDYSEFMITTDILYFPDTVGDNYNTRSYAGTYKSTMQVNFYYGTVSDCQIGCGAYVRCVRTP